MLNLQRFPYLCALLIFAIGYNLDTEYPLIYQAPNSPKISYFGMSVAIRPKAAIYNNSWSIQIGAPRGNINGINISEPGTIYRCHTHGPCHMFPLERKLNEFGGKGKYAYKDKIDGAWIGVSMDVKDFQTHETSVVCGDRWINQNLKNPENIDVTYLMTGVCYSQDLFNATMEGPVRKLLPLVNPDKIYTPKPYVVDLSTYHWGLGQAGTSVKLVDGPFNIIIGAPGLTHWIGGVIRYESDSNLSVGNFAKTEIPRKSRYTYIGYAVTAGKFFKDKETWFVAGAPRSANYHGEVLTFQYKGTTDAVHIQSNLVGSTFGEYFGSALLALDVNNDGFDDLIVGAPLYSNVDFDEGRVYVFLGSGLGIFFSQSQVINGKIVKSRFGSSIASLEDLDQDGFKDVVIGSPYEDNQKGAIYIYRGFSLGLQIEYTQRIGASDLYPYLRGFGISISPAVDVDGNKYKDVAIGSYLSDHVVLLRSRPVVLLHSTIKTERISLIDRKASYFNISLCSTYTGSNAPLYADILRTVEIDPKHGRGFLKSSNISSFKHNIRHRSNEVICQIQTVLLNLADKNYAPLQIILKNELPVCAKTKRKALIISGKSEKDQDGFLKWCPTGNKVETSKEIPFAGMCGSDAICRSDLRLSCSVWQFRSGTYVVGSSDNIRLAMELKNLGEPSQNTKIKIWSNLKVIETDFRRDFSSESPRKTYWLDIDGIVTESYRTNFSFRIPYEAFKEVRGATAELILLAEVYTSSIDMSKDANKCRFSVKLQSDAYVDLYSSSSSTSFFIRKGMTDQELNVTHYYQVQKRGMTPIENAVLTIFIPSYSGVTFSVFEVETAEWMHLSTDSEEHRHQIYDDSKKNANWINANFFGKNAPPENRTLFLNCSNSSTKCDVLKIFFTNGIPTELSSYVKILISLNISALDSLRGNKDIVYFMTNALLEHSKYLENETGKLQGSAFISLYCQKESKPVEGYVIALSVFAGGFLLSLIFAGLIKKNFFRRIKREELKTLKEADESFVYFATDSINSMERLE